MNNCRLCLSRAVVVLIQVENFTAHVEDNGKSVAASINNINLVVLLIASDFVQVVYGLICLEDTEGLVDSADALYHLDILDVFTVEEEGLRIGQTVSVYGTQQDESE